MASQLSENMVKDECLAPKPKSGDNIYHFKMLYFVCLLFYVTFNSQGHIATGSLQVEGTSA